MTSLKSVSPMAEVTRTNQAIMVNISAGKGLQEVLKSNLGPKGTMKMLVSGAGDIKMTKDGNVLLHEMQIQHPTAALIARTATAQDDVVGDGTTTNVILIGELLKQSERYLGEGLHPRVIVEGFDLARDFALKFLEKFKVKAEDVDSSPNFKELLVNIARCSLRTKVARDLADALTEIIVDSVLTIRRDKTPIDLFMVEIMTMQHRLESETRLVKGLVMDHGARHPDMPKKLQNAFIFTCNVSLEYEKTEVNSGFFYKDSEQRARMVDAEHKLVEERTKKIIDLKNTVCDTPDKTFVVINQKGIDPISLDMFAKAGILALRRAKRRNMERLTLACGGSAMNSVDDLTPDVLGRADSVYEQVLGEEKYTFVEGVKNPFSCTILIKGPHKHAIEQLKDAVRDGLRAVKNTIDDASVVPGAGAFHIACAAEMMKFKDSSVTGRPKLGVQAYADALLIVPKVLAENSGFDAIDTMIKLQEEHAKGHNIGLDLDTGDAMDPVTEGVWDQYRVHRQILHSSSVVASQILLVDEIMKAGKGARGGTGQANDQMAD